MRALTLALAGLLLLAPLALPSVAAEEGLGLESLPVVGGPYSQATGAAGDAAQAAADAVLPVVVPVVEDAYAAAHPYTGPVEEAAQPIVEDARDPDYPSDVWMDILALATATQEETERTVDETQPDSVTVGPEPAPLVGPVWVSYEEGSHACAGDASSTLCLL